MRSISQPCGMINKFRMQMISVGVPNDPSNLETK